jgi:hypothetical protein
MCGVVEVAVVENGESVCDLRISGREGRICKALESPWQVTFDLGNVVE